MSHDGTQKTSLKENIYADGIYLIDDWIYFKVYFLEGLHPYKKTCRIKKDGSNYQELYVEDAA